MSPSYVTSVDLELLFTGLAQGGAQAESALSALYDLYAKRFIGLLITRGASVHDAEEIVHDVFIKLHLNGNSASKAKSPRAYLYRMVKNCEADWYRKGKRYVAESLDEEGPSSVPAPNTPAESEGFLACLEIVIDAIDRSEPERAFVIRTAILEQFSRQEVAEMIGRTTSATRQFLCETRKRFLDLLRKRCGDYFPDNASGTS